MRPKRQSVIQHVLVLLVVLAMPHIASADDPCEAADDAVLKFVSSLPRLSSEDLRQGKFDIKDAGAEFLIAYLIKGKQGFQGRISKFIDDNISPSSPEISQINVEGYSALFIKHVVGAGGRGICMYVVAPSPPANRFLVIPESGLYYQKHRGWSELLYWPYVNDRGRVEGLDGLRDAQDIDCDGETELITREIQNWVIFDCNFADFEMPAWKRIYHLSPERQELYEVSAQFPKVYADLGDKLREDQNFRIGSSAEKSPRCEAEAQRLIDEARKMASAGTGKINLCSGNQPPVSGHNLNPSPISDVFKDRLYNIALNAAKPVNERLCEVAKYAKLASEVYAIKETCNTGLFVSLPDDWTLVDWYVDDIGLKAGLYKHPKTNELAVMFAGTEIENAQMISELKKLFPMDTWIDKGVTFAQLEKACLTFSFTLKGDWCTQFGYLIADVKLNTSLDTFLSHLSYFDPQHLLDNPDLGYKLNKALALASYLEPDLNSDLNLVLPNMNTMGEDYKMNTKGEEMFKNAQRIYEKWERGESNCTQNHISIPAGRIILVGGHSLGGTVAQALSVLKNVAGITFNSGPFPLSPDFHKAINYNYNYDRILHVRSNNDPLTGLFKRVAGDTYLKAFLQRLFESVYWRIAPTELCDANSSKCDDDRKELINRYEDIISNNYFYAGGKNWLQVETSTDPRIAALSDNHSIKPLAQSLMTSCQNYPSTSGQVSSELLQKVVTKNNKAASTTSSKSKQDVRPVCNNNSSISSPSIGGAQGALKKFGTGTDGCAP